MELIHIRSKTYHDQTLCGITIDEVSAEPELEEDYDPESGNCDECLDELEP